MKIATPLPFVLSRDFCVEFCMEYRDLIHEIILWAKGLMDKVSIGTYEISVINKLII